VNLEEFKSMWQQIVPNYKGIKTLADVMKYSPVVVKVRKGRQVVDIEVRAYSAGIDDTIVLYSGYAVYTYPMGNIVGVEPVGK